MRSRFSAGKDLLRFLMDDCDSSGNDNPPLSMRNHISGITRSSLWADGGLCFFAHKGIVPPDEGRPAKDRAIRIFYSGKELI